MDAVLLAQQTPVIRSQNPAHEMFLSLISFSFSSFIFACLLAYLLIKQRYLNRQFKRNNKHNKRRQLGERNQGADCIIFSFGSRSKPTKTKQTELLARCAAGGCPSSQTEAAPGGVRNRSGESELKPDSEEGWD